MKKKSCIIYLIEYPFEIEKVVLMKKISELRAQHGNLTQRELADSLNVTQASISRWEQNQLSIGGENLIKLAKFFKVSTDELLGIEDELSSN